MLIPDMILEGNASKLLLGQIDSSLHASLLLRTLNNPHGRTDTSVGCRRHPKDLTFARGVRR